MCVVYCTDNIRRLDSVVVQSGDIAVHKERNL